MPPLSILIKPASSNCNLRCKYCFYHSVAESRSVASYGIMSSETLELLVKRAFEYAEGSCSFAFQGGEPTLAGLDFYENLIELQSKYNTNKIIVSNSIQTNGIIINDEWAAFFAKNQILVGVSLDGTRDIHDLNRIGTTGKGTFGQVINAIRLLNEYKVEFNILTVVNSATVRHIGQIYKFFTKNEFNYLQFIPCLDPLGEQPGSNTYSLAPEKYTYFLKNLFDLWYDEYNKFGNTHTLIRYFDNLIAMLAGHPPESCGMTGLCSCYFVVEADGGVYPCDFYVLDEWNLGNIKEHTLKEMQSSAAGKRFVEVSRHVDPKCKRCEWFMLCRGGCRRSREPFREGLPVINYYCSSYKEFFQYAAGRLNIIAQTLRMQALGNMVR